MMNFDPPNEIVQLQASLRRILDDHYTLDKRSKIASRAPGWSHAVWAELGQMGVIGLMAAPEHGGFGFAAADLLPIFEELGRAMVLEPYLATAVLGATALQVAAEPALLSELMPKAVAGKTILSLAYAEPGGRYEWGARQVQAEYGGGEWHLLGTKINVLHGDAAEYLLVTAVLPSSSSTTSERGLFLVRKEPATAVVRPYMLLDDSPAAEVTFQRARAVLLASGAAADRAVHAALNMATAVAVGEAVGVARAAFGLTVDYVKVRQQFGRAIGTNQAVRHRIAEMAVALETLKSAAILALFAVSHHDPVSAGADISRAKMLVGRHGVKLVQDALQLHGGLGMSQEYGVGNYLRRMTVIDMLFGDANHHTATWNPAPHQFQTTGDSK